MTASHGPFGVTKATNLSTGENFDGSRPSGPTIRNIGGMARDPSISSSGNYGTTGVSGSGHKEGALQGGVFPRHFPK